MQLMLHVSSPDAGRLVARLGAACGRMGVAWGAFFTHAGTRLLEDPAIVAVLSGSARAVACEHSWAEHAGDSKCPVELGSQTINSIMMQQTRHVVSL